MRFYMLLFCCAILYSACGVQQQQNSLPNIIFILTDDLGYADISSYGTDYLQTPHIDSLVNGGMRFTNYHTNSPVCSPTRAALLSGRYPDLIGIPGVVRTDTADSWGYLQPNALLLPQLLKKEYGYNTVHIGKWNLGLSLPNLPNKWGFEHFKGFLGDKMDDYYNHLRQGFNYLRYNEHYIEPDTTHATDLFTAWASEYILSRRKQTQPFFMYLAYNAPHRPTQTTDYWKNRYKERYPHTPEPRATYCAMVEHLDNGIGQIMYALRQAGLAGNTLILFSSDNGGNLEEGANNGEVNGSKTSLYEGGLRVPLAIWFPQKIKDNSQSAALLLSMDIAPTIYNLLSQCSGKDLAVYDKPNLNEAKACRDKNGHIIPFDGISFAPTLLGDSSFAPQRDLFWVWRESGDQFGTGNYVAAYRTAQNLKLLRNKPDAPFELYDLHNDPQEQVNLAQKDSIAAQRIAAQLQERLQMGFKIPCKPPAK
jgi:arylsulfatase A-like enzyme